MFIKPEGHPKPKPVKVEKPKKGLKPRIKPLFSHVGKAEIEGKIIKASELPEKVIKQIKSSKESLTKLKAKLDKVFSIYIRRRYADSNGMVKCYTSGKVMHWKEAHCGHFISRRYLAVRWDENNARPQSYYENMHNQGNAPEFARKLAIEIGEKEFTKLHIKKKNTVKMGVFEYKLLIEEYENKIKNIK